MTERKTATVGIVIVSHSAKLAEGVCELARQMTTAAVSLAAAGGIDDPDQPLGTDPIQVLEAIEAVYSDAGVVVLMDLGSALLSAEMALEFLPEEQRERVRLCAAPLVEGTVAAVVQSAAGGDLEQVLREAQGALRAKADQLGDSGWDPPVPSISASPDAVWPTMAERRVTLPNALGIHARPAAQIVSTASQYTAKIAIRNATTTSDWVSTASINEVLLLGGRKGHEIALTGEGPQASVALDALESLLASGFGEGDAEEGLAEAVVTAQTGLPDSREWVGVGASPGIAVGPLVRLRALPPRPPVQHPQDPAAEAKRLKEAIDAASLEIQAMARSAESRQSAQDATVFAAHRLILQDPALIEAAHQRIASSFASAEVAWQVAAEKIIGRYRRLDDPYLQARAVDVEDVTQRVLRQLGHAPGAPEISEPAILSASELLPSDLGDMDPDLVLGICTRDGTAISHAAILARSLGVPLVVGLGSRLDALDEGTRVGIDGERGILWVCPDAEERKALSTRRKEFLDSRKARRVMAGRPAITVDGQRIHVLANVSGLVDIPRALVNGAEGVGLLRTEFLFMGRRSAPSEKEQVAAYREIARACGTNPLTVRTLDVGGDKPLAYIDTNSETNPLLGWRGVRRSLAKPELFEIQLRALLRASPGRRLRIMFPMVSTLTELRAAKAILSRAQAELHRGGMEGSECVQVGIMIEVPSAAMIADQLATEIDFFSVGTNDLTQYTMAADRTNPHVGTLCDPFHPAVLRMVHRSVQAAGDAGISVSLCGELAGDPLATPILLGLGLTELSMSSASIPRIKQTISTLALTDCEQLAGEVLQQGSAESVRREVRARFPALTSAR